MLYFLFTLLGFVLGSTLFAYCDEFVRNLPNGYDAAIQIVGLLEELTHTNTTD